MDRDTERGDPAFRPVPRAASHTHARREPSAARAPAHICEPRTYARNAASLESRANASGVQQASSGAQPPAPD
jgi:hypothetical protein